MKKSNLIILSGSLLMFGLVIGIGIFSSKYVSISEFNNNQRESKKSIDTDTYNYKTVLFDEPFDEVIIKDTSQNRSAHRSSSANQIQWVKSERTGLKKSSYGEGISSAKVEQNKLIIYISPYPYSGFQLILYSPSLIKVSSDGVGLIKLIDTEKDSLEIDVNLGDVEIAESSHLKKLTIQANKSNVTVKAESIDEANYVLFSNSVVHSQIDSCDRLSIDGDSTSTVSISPLVEDGKPPHSLYKYMSFNDEMGTVVLTAATSVKKIKGNKDRLTLNMTMKQIEETLANITVD